MFIFSGVGGKLVHIYLGDFLLTCRVEFFATMSM